VLRNWEQQTIAENKDKTLRTMIDDGRATTSCRLPNNKSSSITESSLTHQWAVEVSGGVSFWPITNSSEEKMWPRSANCLFMLVVNVCLYMSVVCFFSSSSSIVNSHIDNSWLNEVSCTMHTSQVLFKPIYSHQRVPTCQKLNILNKFHSP